MPKINHSIEISYRNTTHIWEMQDPEKYVSTTCFEVVGVSEDSEKPDTIIGKGQATRVRVGRAIDARESLFYIFDTDQGLVDAGCVIYRPDFRDFRPSVLNQYPDIFFTQDFLLVRELQIFPKFRGRKLGLAVMLQIVSDLGLGCAIAVLEPKPFVTEPNRGGEARGKLRAYWETLGFQRVGSSRFWAIDPEDMLDAAELDLPSCVAIDENEIPEGKSKQN